VTRNRPTRGGAYHWREHRIEDFLPAAESGRRALLLGCKDDGELRPLRDAGFEPVALDLHRRDVLDLMGDAHRLPLKSAAFDLVVSVQVLEHLHSPWIAIREIARVLRPGGWFVGSVAFWKPFHTSYFHMTHLGVRQLCESAGLRVERVGGAQGPIFALVDGLTPIGNRAFRLAILAPIDRAVASLRARIWAWRNAEDPDEPRARFGQHPALGYRAFDALRFAPAVVFAARKSGPPDRRSMDPASAAPAADAANAPSSGRR
jgi:SAM-dependent methyltransferase